MHAPSFLAAILLLASSGLSVAHAQERPPIALPGNLTAPASAAPTASPIFCAN